MRILHAPSNVCNIGWAMAQGLRLRGHHVEVWNHGESPNGFQADRVFEVGKDPSDYARCLLEALNAEFDVFHFHGTRSLVAGRRSLPLMWDLPFLKALGKKIFFTFHGSDIRIRSQHIDEDKWSFYNFADIPCDEERIHSRLGIVSAYADGMTVGSVLDKPYAPQAVYLPKPLDLERYTVGREQRKTKPVILHATRRRETKGSDIIESAAHDLLDQGLEFEFRLVEGLSHSKLLEAIDDADVVVEKLLGGDAGVLSLEAMAMGKVSVARIRDEVLQEHPDMPVVNANPDTFKELLTDLIADHSRRVEIAEKSRRYIEANHSPAVIGGELEDLYATPAKRGTLGFIPKSEHS